jgi:hypothetical protein
MAKDPRKFRKRSARLSRAWGEVAFTLHKASTTGTPTRLPAHEAISALWLNPL